VRYSLAERYVNLFVLIYSGEVGAKLMKHFKGDASYKSLEISGILEALATELFIYFLCIL
jgi:hypothetical protein